MRHPLVLARPLLSVLLLPAVVLSGLVATTPATAAAAETPAAPAEPGAVRTEVTTYPLAVVPDGAGSAPGTVAARNALASVSAVGPEVAVPGVVRVVGTTWARGAGDADVQVQVRREEGGAWSAWEPLEAEDASDAGEGGTRAGTEPYVVAGSERVQVRLSGPAEVVATARMEVVDPGVSAAGSGPAALSSTTDSVTGRPTILSRAAWGADESLRRGAPSYSPVRAAVIHHTAGSNSYTQAQTASVLRGIYAYHVTSRGWSDIGYNVLADRYGRLWEGRHGGLDRGVVGAQVAGYNTGSFGISVMGSFETTAPPQATLDAVARAIAWKLSLEGVSAAATTTLAGRSIPTVVAHRDLGQTACPGAAFYARVPAVRTAARAYQLATPTPPTPTPPTPTPPTPPPVVVPVPVRVPLLNDLTGDGYPDVVSRTSTQVRLSALVPVPVRSATAIGSGWQGMDTVLGSPDLTGDGLQDLVARQPSTGRLWIYHGDGRGGFRGSTVLGPGWNSMAHLLTPGDWNGDGRADLLAVQAGTGLLYLYRGTAAGGFSSGVVIGNGWQSMRVVVSAGDLDGDRRPDVAAVDAGGVLRRYPGSGKGGFLRPDVLSDAWEGYDRLVGVGDFDADGHDDLVARATDGSVSTFFGDGTGSVGPPMTWGHGWDGHAHLVGPGDWDGDGRVDLLAVNRAAGGLFLYRGLAARDYAAARVLALPATGVRSVFVVGDVDGAGRPDLISVDTQGRLHLSLVTGDGVVGPRRQIGSGWTGMDVVTAAGDLTGDGVPDVLARQAATGKLFLYPLTRGGSFGSPVQVGNGWGGFDQITGVGPWDDGPTSDVIARRVSDGALFLYRSSGPGKLGSAQQIGSRWSGISQFVAAGDVDRDGAADLIARTRAGVDLLYRGTGTGGFAGSRQMQGLPADGELS